MLQATRLECRGQGSLTVVGGGAEAVVAGDSPPSRSSMSPVACVWLGAAEVVEAGAGPGPLVGKAPRDLAMLGSTLIWDSFFGAFSSPSAEPGGFEALNGEALALRPGDSADDFFKDSIRF